MGCYPYGPPTVQEIIVSGQMGCQVEPSEFSDILWPKSDHPGLSAVALA